MSGSNSKDHLCQTGSYKGILSRSDTVKYKGDARSRMKGLGIYDNVVSIRAAIQRTTPKDTVDNTIPKYLFDFNGNDNKKANFAADFAGNPYFHNAHHMLVCELFYDEKWEYQYLDVVLQCEYDINNPDNIIYLPQDGERKGKSKGKKSKQEDE